MDDEHKPTAPSAHAELDATLGLWRAEQAAEQSAEEDQRAALLSGWGRIAPLLDEAIGRVNAVLSKHGYNGIKMAAPQFHPDGASYGAEGRIPGINQGDLVVVLSAEMDLYFHVCRGGHWREGHSVPIQVATVEDIANDLAGIAKWLIVQEPV